MEGGELFSRIQERADSAFTERGETILANKVARLRAYGLGILIVLVKCKQFCTKWLEHSFVCFFVFVALRPMSTAMVIAGRSVHLTTLFPGQARASG